MVRNFRLEPNYLAGTITERVGPLTYTVKVNRMLLKRHVDHIKTFGNRNVTTEFSSDESSGSEYSNLTRNPQSTETPPPDHDNQATDSETARYPHRNRHPLNRLDPQF